MKKQNLNEQVSRIKQMMGLNEDDYSTERQMRSFGGDVNSNQRYVVFLPLNDDGTVQIDSEYFGLYNDEEFDKYINPILGDFRDSKYFNVINRFDSEEFPNRDSAEKFKELVVSAGGNLDI